MTGRVHRRTGIESWIPPDQDVQLGPREVTIATLLKRAGYATFMAGKWHLNGGLEVARHTQPNDHGFDHWLALHAWAIPHHENPTNFYRNGKPVGPMKGFAAEIVVDEALTWLDGRGRGASAASPFFMYLPFAEPHGTIASPPRFNELYAAFTRGRPDPFPNEDRYPPNLAARGPGEYYANVSHLDHQVGRLLERLDGLGLRENTLVIFTSDNGPVTTDWRHWWEVNLYGDTGGFRGRKADLYEGGIRVPALVRWPGRVPAGSVSDAPVIGYDLLPTLAVAPRPRGPDGPGDRRGGRVRAAPRGGGGPAAADLLRVRRRPGLPLRPAGRRLEAPGRSGPGEGPPLQPPRGPLRGGRSGAVRAGPGAGDARPGARAPRERRGRSLAAARALIEGRRLADPVAALGLGTVERRVGPLEGRRGLFVGPQLRRSRRHGDGRTFSRRRLFDGHAHLLREHQGSLPVVGGQDAQELFAAPAHEGVGGSEDGPQGQGDLAQDLVAPGVSALVVDGLEMVDVDEDEAERRLEAGAPGRPRGRSPPPRRAGCRGR